MTVGKRLKEERKRLRLTQQEMADACGISKWTQLSFEKDQHMPGGAYFLAAAARGVDVVYALLEQRTQMEPTEAALLAAFRTASADARARALAAVGLAPESASRASPAVSLRDSEVGQMITTTGDLDQSDMQINMGGRKKKKS